MFTEVVEKLLCYNRVYRGCREVAVLQSHLQRLWRSCCATGMFTEVVFKLCYSHVYRDLRGRQSQGFLCYSLDYDAIWKLLYCSCLQELTRRQSGELYYSSFTGLQRRRYSG